jgi:tetratricopeptide (TPR) repeat protein
VTERTAPKEGTAPTIPTTLLARAWHGRGDAIHAMAAQATSDEVTKYLGAAAEYYEQAAQTLPSSDPLWGETKLDRANVLYELAEAAARRYEQRLAGTPAQQPTDASSQLRDASLQGAHPLAEIAVAQSAYREAQEAYSQAVAPAVWAEIQRRHGDLCLMEAQCFLPASTQLPQPTAGGAGAAVNPLADPTKALERAKKARHYFVAARDVFAPSYLPVSWSRAQLGLARALLIIARAVAPTAKSQAWVIYSLCLETTKAAATKVSTLAQAPLDWVDLQLLRAEAEIGRAPLDDGGAPPHYKEAASILDKTINVLTDFERIPGNSRSERMKGQEDRGRSLRRALNQVLADP